MSDMPYSTTPASSGPAPGRRPVVVPPKGWVKTPIMLGDSSWEPTGVVIHSHSSLVNLPDDRFWDENGYLWTHPKQSSSPALSVAAFAFSLLGIVTFVLPVFPLAAIGLGAYVVHDDRKASRPVNRLAVSGLVIGCLTLVGMCVFYAFWSYYGMSVPQEATSPISHMPRGTLWS